MRRIYIVPIQVSCPDWLEVGDEDTRPLCQARSRGDGARKVVASFRENPRGLRTYCGVLWHHVAVGDSVPRIGRARKHLVVRTYRDHVQRQRFSGTEKLAIHHFD